MVETAARLKKTTHVLIIEDPGTLLCLLEHVLHLQGYNVVTTDVPLHAFDLALQLQPDLIVLDVGMTGVNGFSLARILRAHPNTADISIIFLSVRSTADALARAKELRADAHDVHPVQ